MYTEYTRVSVPSSELGPPTGPHTPPQESVFPHLDPKGEVGATLAFGWGGGGPNSDD